MTNLNEISGPSPGNSDDVPWTQSSNLKLLELQSRNFIGWRGSRRWREQVGYTISITRYHYSTSSKSQGTHKEGKFEGEDN